MSLLRSLPFDLLLQCLKMLHPHESVAFVCINRQYYEGLAKRKDLWEYYCHEIIGSFQAPNDPLFVPAAMTLLKVQSLMTFLRVMLKFEYSLVGWFRVLPDTDSSPPDPLGAIVKIQPVYDSQRYALVFEQFNSVGQLVALYDVYYEPAEDCLYMKDRDGVLTFTLRSDSEDLSIEQVPASIGAIIQTIPIRRLQPLPPFTRASEAAPCNLCVGVYTATYGAHGPEIIHVSIVERDYLTYFSDSLDDDRSLQVPCIEGLKLTGDPNVPADKMSFLANISASIPPQDMQQERMIVVFHHRAEPELVTLADRIQHVAAIYRGKGQINRDPNNPLYELVDLSLLVYTRPLHSNGAVFSIIWDDEGQLFQHMMDFLPAPPMKSSIPVESELKMTDTLSWDTMPYPDDIIERYHAQV